MERQQADQTLRMSEDFNRRIIEAAPCGIVQVSLEGVILKANPVAQMVLGLTFEEHSRRYAVGFESETFWEDGSVCALQDHPVSKCLTTHQPQPATTIGVRRADGRMACYFGPQSNSDPPSLSTLSNTYFHTAACLSRTTVR